MKNKEKIILTPIGTILGENPMDHTTIIKIHPEYRKALKNLEQWSHIIILWWAHKSNRNKQIMEKRKNSGAFATRSQHRPNPIMLTITRLIKTDTQKGIITVETLDAWKGSPILDIKPYTPKDKIPNPKTPEWYKEKTRKTKDPQTSPPSSSKASQKAQKKAHHP